MKDLKAITAALIFAGVSANALQAKAEVYMTAGIGQAQINYIGNDGVWAQKKGWQSEEREKTPAFHIGFGKDFYSWLSGEVLYHDLGTYSMFAGFGQSDIDYERTHGKCDKPCPTMYGYGIADIKGLSISMLPSYNFNQGKVFARLGMLRYKADWQESYTGNGMYMKGQEYNRDYDIILTPNPYGWSPMFGGGLEYKHVRVEYLVFSQIMPKESALKKVNYISVGYRF